VTEKTYTEEELRAALEAAVTPLAAQLREAQTAAQVSEVEARIASIKEEAQAEIDEVQRQLDAAVLEREAAKGELAAFKADIEALATEEAHKAEVASRREARVAKAKEVASFPDDYVEEHADRWAALTDEEFEGRCAEWAAINPSGMGSPIPLKTAFTASRESTTNQGGMGAIREVMRLPRNLDPRRI